MVRVLDGDGYFRRRLAGDVHRVGADDGVEAEREPLQHDIDPVRWRGGDQRYPGIALAQVGDRVGCTAQQRRVLVVDGYGGRVAPLEKILPIHCTLAVLGEAVVDVVVVRPRDLFDVDVFARKRSANGFADFPEDSEVLGVDQHPVHIKADGVHAFEAAVRCGVCSGVIGVACPLWNTAGALGRGRRQRRMDGTYDSDVVRAGRQAREQFYDARGYGRPDDGDVVLDPVEAAHLLFRGDLDAVVDDGKRLDFRSFLSSTVVSEVEFFVYKDMRDRGFYLSPTRETEGTADFAVYPRGDGPWDDTTAYRVRAVSERASVSTRNLETLASADGDGTGVLAVVDEESEVTYLELDQPAITGSTHHDIPAVDGDLLADRVLVWEPPTALHGRAFYGQRLDQEGNAVQLSLVEAAYLAGEGLLTITDGRAGGDASVVDRGRDVEGERFDRRLRVYSALRTAGLVPKTGFKFGADFRTYADVGNVDDLGHSELLVRVLPTGHEFSPRDLALDVRLSGGVRKRMVFALTPVEGDIEWVRVGRLTP